MTITRSYTAETVDERTIAKAIDHSLLKPELTIDEVVAGCDGLRRMTWPRSAHGHSTSFAASRPLPAATSSWAL